MPFYALTIDAVRHAPKGYSGVEASRTFVRHIEAESPHAARVALMAQDPRGPISGAVTDPKDGAWFDSGTVRHVRAVSRYRVVTRDSSAWHSNGVTGETVFYAKGDARRYYRRTLAKCKPGQTAYLVTDKAAEPKIVQSFPGSVHVTDCNAVSARSAASRCAAVARKHFGGPVMVVSSGGTSHPDHQVDYNYVFVPRS